MNEEFSEAGEITRDGLLDIAALGYELEQFWGSRIGQYLLARIEKEVESGVAALRRVDPDNAKAVRAAQNKVEVAESIRAWLSAGISDGLRAKYILEERDDA